MLAALSLALGWLALQGRTGSAPLALDSAYLWQRQWSPEIAAATQAIKTIRELRVLALEIDAAGTIRWPERDLAALRASGRILIAVIRIDGRRPPLDAATLAAQLDRLIDAWRTAGVALEEIELDHDCARARLAEYRTWIQQLRARLVPGIRLSLTGLPDWLASTELPALVAAVDGFTLQVHAVDQPQFGVMTRDRALFAARTFAARVDQPFSIALPTYAARIEGRLYWSEPEQIELLLKELREHPVPGLLGVRWFRLPIAGGTDTWSAATLDAVIAGRTRQGGLQLRTRVNADGALDLSLDNPGALDWPLPARIEVRGECTGDAAAGFSLQMLPGGRGQVFLRVEADRLAPGRLRALGWLRCKAQPEIRIHAQDTAGDGIDAGTVGVAGSGLRTLVSA